MDKISREYLIDDNLDPAQKEAVMAKEPRLLVSAGPGSGKTRVLVARLKRLISEGVQNRPLCLTFTNKAALVMKERADLTGSSVFIGTFHLFCLRLLSKERPGFILLDRTELVTLLRERGVKDTKGALDKISTYKSGLYRTDSAPLTAELLEEVDKYSAWMKSAGAFDLDDLIIETIKLFEEEPVTLKRYQGQYADLLVDEFQDINPAQMRLVKLLTSREGTLFCIGDIDQTIYGFRGANLAGFTSFTNEYSGARIIRLTKNYRSRSLIVKASRYMMQDGEDLQDFKAFAEGGEVISMECADVRGEGNFVTAQIKKLLGAFGSLSSARGSENDYGFSDFAVLYRTNHQSAILSESFQDAGLPHQVIGRIAYGELAEFSDALRSVDLSFLRPFADIVEVTALQVGLDPLLIERLKSMTTDSMSTEDVRGAFLDEIKLMVPQDLFDIAVDRVTLSTIHMAKGLEFKVVFIVGCEDGLIPLVLKGRQTDMAEERRVLYVGMTRAEERLYLLHTEDRKIFGVQTTPMRSRLLGTIPGEIMRTEKVNRKYRKRRPVQESLFD